MMNQLHRIRYRTRATGMITLLSLMLLLLSWATVAAADEVNLALGKTCQVITGGSLSASKPPGMVDGDINTMWRSYNSSSPKTLTGIVSCDLGYVSTINRIVITEYKQKSVRIVVKLSTDGTNWTVVGDQRFQAIGSANRRSEYPVGGQSARYVRIEAEDAVYAFGIYELEVYGIPTEQELKDKATASALPSLTAPQVVDSIPFNKEDFHIYLLIGQSNMSGRDSLAPIDKFVIDRTYLLNKQERWELAQPWPLEGSSTNEIQGLNRYSSVEVLTKLNGLNLATYFATTIVANQPGIGIGIVSNAKGGTAISEWVKGSELYNEAVRRAKIAMQYGTLKGILWHQGEADRTNTAYISVLTKLITDLRNDLGIPDLPFIAGELPLVGDASKVKNSSTFNTRLAPLPQRVAYTAVVSAAGLRDLGDGTHIDAAGQRLFGQRYAIQTLKMIYNMTDENIKLAFMDEATQN
jgi:hypothetical protein